MVRGKRGWMRILEATLAVLLVTSVLLISYSRHVDRGIDSGEYIYLLQKEILKEIYLDEEMKSAILAEPNVPDIVQDYLDEAVPGGYVAKIRICNADLNIQPSCKLRESDFSGNNEWTMFLEREVYVEEIILSANLTDYSPKKVKLFVWEDFDGFFSEYSSWKLFGENCVVSDSGDKWKNYEFLEEENGDFTIEFRATPAKYSSNPNAFIFLSNGAASSVTDSNVAFYLDFDDNNKIFASNRTLREDINFGYNDDQEYSFKIDVSTSLGIYNLEIDGTNEGTYDFNLGFVAGSIDNFGIGDAETGNFRICNPEFS